MGRSQLFGEAGMGAEQEWAKSIASFGGSVSSDCRVAYGDMEKDPQYRKSLLAIKERMAESKMLFVQDNMSSDISKETFEEYMAMKQWWFYWTAGDRASAAAAMLEPDSQLLEPGELF